MFLQIPTWGQTLCAGLSSYWNNRERHSLFGKDSNELESRLSLRPFVLLCEMNSTLSWAGVPNKHDQDVSNHLSFFQQGSERLQDAPLGNQCLLIGPLNSVKSLQRSFTCSGKATRVLWGCTHRRVTTSEWQNGFEDCLSSGSSKQSK